MDAPIVVQVADRETPAEQRNLEGRASASGHIDKLTAILGARDELRHIW